MDNAGILRVVCDRMRYDMLGMLARSGGMSVGQLVDATGRTQPLVSHHLRILREAGIVEAERDGRRAIYRIRGRRVQGALARVDSSAARLRRLCR